MPGRACTRAGLQALFIAVVIETKADFKRLKPQMMRIADTKTFKNFAVAVPETVDIEAYGSVIVWCETFSQFITAAKYK